MWVRHQVGRTETLLLHLNDRNIFNDQATKDGMILTEGVGCRGMWAPETTMAPADDESTDTATTSSTIFSRAASEPRSRTMTPVSDMTLPIGWQSNAQDGPKPPTEQLLKILNDQLPKDMDKNVVNMFFLYRNKGLDRRYRCRICGSEGQCGRGTSGLKKHLARHTRPAGQSGGIAQFATSYSASRNKTPYGKRPLPSREQRYAIIKYVIKSNSALATTDQEAFRELIDKFNDTVRLPSRRTITRDINLIFERVRPQVVERIRKRGGKIALQHDGWTSECQLINYLGLMASYMEVRDAKGAPSSNWKMHTVLLSLDETQFSIEHTADAIADDIFRILRDDNLTDRVVALVTDSGSGNPQVFEHLKELLQNEGVALPEGSHVRCAAHVINLVAEDFLKALDATISLIGRLSKSKTKLAEKKRKEKSISSGKRKMTRTTRFTAQALPGDDESMDEEEEVELGSPDNEDDDHRAKMGELPTYGDAVNRMRFAGAYILSSAKRKRTFLSHSENKVLPISEAKTRWNTTFLMLQRAQRIKQELLTAAVDEEARPYWPTEKDFRLVEPVFDVLQCIYGASTTFQKEGADTSVGIQVITMNELFDQLEDLPQKSWASKDFPEPITEVRLAISCCTHKLRKYYGKTGTEVHCVGTYCDPRFRKNLWTSVFEQEWLDISMNKVDRVFKSSYEKRSRSSVSPTDSGGHRNATHKDPNTGNSFLKAAMKNLQESAGSTERQSYEAGHWTGDFFASADEIISWWAQRRTEYPNLSQMASDFLPIPASVASNERCFSDARNLIRYNRSRLNPQTVNRMKQIKSWLDTYGADWVFKAADLAPLREDDFDDDVTFRGAKSKQGSADTIIID